MAWLHKLGLSYLRLSLIANDVARLSSIKIERGTDYPYARTFTFLDDCHILTFHF
jgi:hypothetical protein